MQDQNKSISMHDQNKSSLDLLNLFQLYDILRY